MKSRPNNKYQPEIKGDDKPDQVNNRKGNQNNISNLKEAYYKQFSYA
jgi:hypothetical protein